MTDGREFSRLQVDLDVDEAAHAGLRAVAAHAELRRNRLDGRNTLLSDQRSAAPADVRVQLREIVHTRGHPCVTVTLLLRERRFVGIGRSQPDAPATLERVAGEATVHAINRLIQPCGQLRLDHVRRTGLGQLTLCLVQLTVVVEAQTHTTVGVSIIRADAAEAAARSVLDATNRFLPRLLAGRP